MQSIIWVLNRLRSMSLPELVYRTGEKAKKIAAKNRLEGWARYENAGPPPVLPGLREHVATLNAEKRQNIAREAEDTLNGRFSALGREWPCRAPDNLFYARLWALDPVTEKLWPEAETYCFDIPYRHERTLGDVKYVWEINRLQFLHPLAAQVLFSSDSRALAAIEAAITSWHAANPPFRGLGWSSGVEVALRAISFLVVSTLAGEKLASETVARIRAILSASLLWLARYPSRFSSANNHLIAECAGEFLISLAMPELAVAAKIHAEARRVLEEEALKQFHADGVPAEQSPSYGAFSAEFLLLAHMVEPLSPEAFARLKRFAGFIHWLSDEKRRTPAIGDDDESRVLNFASGHGAYASGIACRIAPQDAPQGVRVFREGGYSIVRQGRWHLVFDHGPLGYLSIAAHGHADALSICVSLDGEPLLVDPGTYLYHSGGKERDWFRSTPAHNTLNIERANQSVISGPFNWSYKARCLLEETREDSDWRITASHDGYERRFGTRHQRTVAADNRGILVKDCLTGAPREAEIAFQLAADLSARTDGQTCRIARTGRDIAAITFDTPGTLALEEGAVSPAFGVKTAAPRLTWRGPVGKKGVCVILTAS